MKLVAPMLSSRVRFFRSNLLVATGLLALVVQLHLAAAPAELTVTGDWTVKVVLADPPMQAEVKVMPPKAVEVTNERVESLPVFKTKGGGWTRGERLQHLRAFETTTPYLLDPKSLVVRAGTNSDAETFKLGEDYQAELTWGTVGRLAGGHIGEKQPVFLSYRYTPLRMDAIVLTPAGKIEWRAGTPKAAGPWPLALQSGEKRLANVWLPGLVEKLTADNLFPVLETAYPEPAKPSPTIAEERIPKAMAKLKAGGALRILAWGDSVTEGSYLPRNEHWQELFVERLRARFPQAKIELVTEAWGGRNTGSYLGEPPGSIHNYQEKVLAVKPDLIISEFVNDAGLTPVQVEERYGKLLADFQGIGAEWIILTPHYTRPDFMGLKKERDIDQDPRPYVKGLREFTEKHHLALADASLRYGRLWRQGIPHSTLMVNAINHPDIRGMRLFADSLMALFP